MPHSILRFALPILAVLSFPTAAAASDSAPGAGAGGIWEALLGREPAPDPPPSPFLHEPDAAGRGEARPPRSPDREDLYYEGETLELQVTPGFTTFFCNPYSFAARGAESPRIFRLDAEDIPEIHLGLMGKLHERVRIGLFSTVSGLAFRDDFPFPDRLRELRTHRVALLLALTPTSGLGLAAGGGADVAEAPRSYEFEILVEARVRF